MSSRVISTFRLSAILAATTSSTDIAGSWRAPHSRSVRYLCGDRGVVALSSDRYVIRTRNLQDWNLTRYRCANRSVEESRERDAARALFGVVDLAQAHGALAQARVRREDGVLTLTGAADGLTHLGLLDLC